MKNILLYIFCAVFFITGFPVAWVLILLNKKVPFLPDQGCDFFGLSVVVGVAIWVLGFGLFLWWLI